jgi:hypothetical protein
VTVCLSSVYRRDYMQVEHTGIKDYPQSADES